ncbi:hypothetical protein N8086_00090 [Pelagibacteraceae bacterium]|jgi:hypothetical protein|nr:hypothetical protein [Candidatus Pelagibacter sp.]MDC1485301.1 hypothetical protein [Pelagibacteraceae bacterium]|tara:strand:- start:329 stop:475 length:147 start_codon:yes stop_codon:yes gene_type:complete
MSSKKALKQAQKLAFQKHKVNNKSNKFLPKSGRFSLKINKKNRQKDEL